MKKTFLRLQHIRQLQERAAERDLSTARIQEVSAFEVLKQLREQECSASQHMVAALVAGDPESIRLDQLDYAVAKAEGPKALTRLLALGKERDVANQRYVEARIESDMLDHLVEEARWMQRKIAAAIEQKLVDDAFLMRLRWSARKDALGSRSQAAGKDPDLRKSKEDELSRGTIVATDLQE